MDERLGSKAAAAHAGVSPVTWRGYVFRGTAPKPDGVDQGFGKDYWLKSTVTAWKENRIGQGKRTDLKRDGPADE